MTKDDTSSRYARGAAKMAEVYAGTAALPPEGAMAFTDVMIRSLFAEVWTREVLSIRDRRLLVMGVIAAQGADDVWAVQSAAALANGELTPEELRETLILLAPYAGYPRVSSLIGATEKAIHKWEKAQTEASAQASPEP